MSEKRPIMYMIAGPNGAGKSTLHRTVIEPSISAPFINADVIQRDELKDPSMQASYKAAAIAEERRRECLVNKISFVTESTFSHPSKLELLQDAKDHGFRVVVYHVNVRSPELSVKRVGSRFREGGHDVPEDKIRERYARNPALIRQAVLLADRGFVYDNSALGKPPELAAAFRSGEVVYASKAVPAWARELYAEELKLLSPARLNPAAASFEDARILADRHAGGKGEVRVASPSSSYTGSVVAESSMHWLQNVAPGAYVAHFKSSVQTALHLQRSYRLEYDASGRVATAHPELPVSSRGADSAAAVALKLAKDTGLSGERLAEARRQIEALAAKSSGKNLQVVDKAYKPPTPAPVVPNTSRGKDSPER